MKKNKTIIRIILLTFYFLFLIYELYFKRVKFLSNYEKEQINDVIEMTINGYNEQLFKFSKDTDFRALNVGNENSYKIMKGDSIFKMKNLKKITVFRKNNDTWIETYEFNIR
ncbi:hypothetical protein [Flavobacterium sp.]|uniref:hypothetical protein n=1 Tax=Flavobacterium sp. TaxID=239 RepID=UPI003528C900